MATKDKIIVQGTGIIVIPENENGYIFRTDMLKAKDRDLKIRFILYTLIVSLKVTVWL